MSRGRRSSCDRRRRGVADVRSHGGHRRYRRPAAGYSGRRGLGGVLQPGVALRPSVRGIARLHGGEHADRSHARRAAGDAVRRPCRPWRDRKRDEPERIVDRQRTDSHEPAAERSCPDLGQPGRPAREAPPGRGHRAPDDRLRDSGHRGQAPRQPPRARLLRDHSRRRLHEPRRILFGRAGAIPVEQPAPRTLRRPPHVPLARFRSGLQDQRRAVGRS